MNTNGPRWDVAPPSGQYLEQLDALAPDDPVRGVLDGLEFELERSPWPDNRSWGLDDDGPTNRYWVIESDREQGGPLVWVVFEVWNRRLTRLAFSIREP